MRQLRVAFEVAANSSGVTIITAPEPNDGKTTLAARLALSLKSIGRSVLLIDSDLRNPSVARTFNHPRGNGLSELLMYDEQPTNYIINHPKGVDILSAGSPPEDPADVLHQPRLAALIEQFRKEYDQIIIDTAPLDPVADALPICELADYILLLIRERSTDRRALSITEEWLNPYKNKIIGMIYNGAKTMTGYGYY